MTTILGAGLSGISASFHLGHQNCHVFEKNNYLGGHIHSSKVNGFVWDEGPHVSFTKNEYVRELLADNVEQEFLDYPVETANYYKGAWIPHPAQSNMFAIPQPLRDDCLNDFLDSREQDSSAIKPANYEEWLLAAFGKTFYQTFPKSYTEKYWTVHPKVLTTDWVGDRVFYPNIDDVKSGYLSLPNKQTHYISNIRYPKQGGYFSYVNKLKQGLNVRFDKELSYISFAEKLISFKDGTEEKYECLINTIPLPELIEKSDAPSFFKKEADKLSCSSVLLINVTVNHPTQLKYNWMYVYDIDKYSTRINCTELLSPSNAPIGKSGIQVEVYFSKYKEKLISNDEIAKRVCDELIEMGLIISKHHILDYHTQWVQWANVIFDVDRKKALNNVLEWLSQFGLKRNNQDLDPMTVWDDYTNDYGTLIMAGRFAEWKYYWTDDCILKGKSLED